MLELNIVTVKTLPIFVNPIDSPSGVDIKKYLAILEVDGNKTNVVMVFNNTQVNWEKLKSRMPFLSLDDLSNLYMNGESNDGKYQIVLVEQLLD